MRARALLAALALAATATADEITLLPAQPVAPTRTEQMMMAGTLGYDAAPIEYGPACDRTYRQIVAGFFHRLNTGVAMPLRCGCWAAETNFLFGGCKQFYNPQWECNACGILGCGARFAPIHYGPGSRGLAPSCKTPPFTALPNSQ